VSDIDVKGFRDFLMTRRRLWMPPVIVTLVLFVILLFFYRGHEGTVFHYKLF
jgi:hypothetical protein